MSDSLRRMYSFESCDLETFDFRVFYFTETLVLVCS